MASTASRFVAVASCSGPSWRDMVDEDGAHPELAERIGAIGRDGKHPARAEQVDRVGLGERLDGAGQFLRAHGVAHPLQRHGGGIGEAFEQGRRMDVMPLRIAQAAQTLAIIGKAFAQAIAKDLLQMGEAVIAEALGEAHQGGGLHARMLGDARHRAEGHLLRDAPGRRRRAASAVSASHRGG